MDAIHNKTQKISERDIKAYIIERFEKVKQKNKIKYLVEFQAMNKYMIMVHDQQELKILGNIVASYKKIQFSEILIQYEKQLKKTLEKEPTRKKHSNVIMRIFMRFSKNLSATEKEKFLNLLAQYKQKEIDLKHVLAKIEPIIYRIDNTYFASQTYFLLYLEPHLKLFYNLGR